MPDSTIFGLIPFVPKRMIVLPWSGGGIHLYVMDGKGYLTSLAERRIAIVRFSGWAPTFRNQECKVPSGRILETIDDLAHCELEVVFRLVPHSAGDRPQTAEIVAVSLDGCTTFFNNELCTLPKEYEAR